MARFAPLVAAHQLGRAVAAQIARARRHRLTEASGQESMEILGVTPLSEWVGSGRVTIRHVSPIAA